MKLLCLVPLILFACAQPPEESDLPTNVEREIEVNALLVPLVNQLAEGIGEKRAGVAPFDKDGTDYEPRVSRYIVPKLIDQLKDKGVQVFERKDLDTVVRELKRQLSDMVDEDTRVEMGNISGVEVLAIGTVKDLSLSVYRIEVKLVDLKTAEIVLTDFVDISRDLLPIAYGGK